ncbi:MAG TPA: PQQ-binding-like beta-propeller repeat protein [Candidatus Baltobacteraceae bacterium]|nr:PQQ-binding-like beta-propeller repeat protein [Candidatus Baltobacteraceae bacterium]
MAQARVSSLAVAGASLVAAAASLSGCMKPAARLAVAQPAPMTTPVRGEQTQPLPIRIGLPVDPGPALQNGKVHALPSTIDIPPNAASNGAAYYYQGGSMIAFDLVRASVRWRRTAQGLPNTIVATPYGVAFVQQYPQPLTYLSAQTGAQIFGVKDTTVSGALDGVLFAKNNDTFSFFAADAKTGEKLWGTYGGGMQIAGPPQIRDGTLLQPFVDDGAILETRLYAFDPANGHAKWDTLSNAQPLGFRSNVVYVDSTWFPEQMDNYMPLTVAAIDIRSGKKLDEFTYAPDPQQNAATYRNSNMKAYVAGGFVYLKVNGTWYRYDADRDASDAHPSRLQNVDIVAAFDSGTLLANSGHNAYVATGSESAMTLRTLPGGAIRSPVAQGANGIAYAVAGTTLYRFNSQGDPHAVGSVGCGSVEAVLPWPGHVAVMCAHHEELFADSSQAAPVAIAPQRIPQGRLALHAFTLPPAPGFMHQWWVGPVTPSSNGGVVMSLDHGALNFAGAIAYVSKDGRIRTIPDGRDLAPPPPGSRFAPTQPRSQWPPKPTTIVQDTSGNVWFNNALWPVLYKLDTANRLTNSVVGETSANAWRRGAIRLARGPDGQAWFARSHPTREIARADGSRAFPIPLQYGDALILVPARDGFWFLSQTQLVHMTLTGRFTATPLPAELQNVRTGPGLRVTSAGDALWIASGAYVARMNERGVLAHYNLPDATLGVNAMVTGCDGSLYIAENAPEVLRLRPGAKSFERYDIEYRQLDGFTRTPDCTIWFVEGSNMPTQHVGTLAQ